MKKKILILVMVVLSFGTVSGSTNYYLVQAETQLPANPMVDKNAGLSKWNRIYFGSYWQSDTNKDSKADQKDAKEKIKWRVLQVKDKHALLLADQNLDAIAYKKDWRNATWETSDIRSWLNEFFYQEAFSKEERDAVQVTAVENKGQESVGVRSWMGYVPGSVSNGEDTTDRVFLLSEKEVTSEEYGFSVPDGADSYGSTNTRVSVNTAFTANGGSGGYSMSKEGFSEGWWLRTMGYNQYLPASVMNTGALSYGYYDSDFGYIAVRPVIWIDLSERGLWTAAEDVVEKHAYEKKESTSPNNQETREDSTSQTKTSKDTGGSSTKSSASRSDLSVSSVKKPAKVTGMTVKRKFQSAKIQWKKIPEVNGYQIQYATNKKFTKGKKAKKTKKTSITITKMKKKKTYYFRVRAYKKAGGQTKYGKWSAVKKIKIKK